MGRVKKRNSVRTRNKKFRTRQPLVVFMGVTFPMYEVLEATTTETRVKNGLNFKVFFTVDEIGRGSGMRIGMESTVDDSRTKF